MIRLFLILLLSVYLVMPAQADQQSKLAKIYTAVAEEYVEPVEVGDFAILVLKSLNSLDKRIHIADDGRRISLYAGGRVVKSLNKPENTDDIQAWVRLTQDFIRTACQVSPALERRDFELADRLMVDAFPKLDHASAYYNGFDSENKHNTKGRRYYSERMIDNILYIRLGAFNKYTKENILKSLKNNRIFSGVILDLRGNPGGLLSEAVEVSGLFLDKGSVIASARGRSADSANIYIADGGDVLEDKPLVILIDGATASSAEVMSAALKEQGRAQLVGTRSYGKGSVQKLIMLEDGSSLALTDAYFYTPAGKKIDQKGLVPDVCLFEKGGLDKPERIISSRVSDCPSELRENKDIDVETALELINKNI